MRIGKTQVVIPAKAGIHIPETSRFRKESLSLWLWIPAFAGMTWMIFFAPLSLQARPIIADLALKEIEINTNFTGINILLFGARDEAGDVVVVVRGPKRNYIVRKKERFCGVWINREQEKFDNIYGFYAISSSKALERIDNEYLLAALGIGIDNWNWLPDKDERFAPNNEFKKALYSERQKSGLFTKETGKVSFWGETLFRTNIWFPANIEGGTYIADVYLISDGQLVSVQSTPIRVKKIGFEAFVYEFAHKHGVLYGILAVSMALFVGWLANMVFRKV